MIRAPCVPGTGERGGRMSRELERLLAQRVARRDLLKYAGMGAGMTAFLAAWQRGRLVLSVKASGRAADVSPVAAIVRTVDREV